VVHHAHKVRSADTRLGGQGTGIYSKILMKLKEKCLEFLWAGRIYPTFLCFKNKTTPFRIL